MAAAQSELRRRGKKGPVELVSKSTVTKDELEKLNTVEHKDIDNDNDKKQDNDNEGEEGYSAEFWYELKYTIVRCVLMVVIFFILNHFFNKYLLDPFFHRGEYYKNQQRQRKLNDIRSRVCPQGAMDCNVDLSNLNNLNL